MAGNISNRLNRVLRVCNEKAITEVAYKSFRDYTPYNTGNAYRNTKKTGNSINADYPYAGRLDEGYSNQAPDGMTIPTIKDIRKYISKTLGVKI